MLVILTKGKCCIGQPERLMKKYELKSWNEIMSMDELREAITNCNSEKRLRILRFFTSEVCRILRIKEPKVSFDNSVIDEITGDFNSPSVYEQHQDVIYIRSYFEPVFMTFFSIASELRHTWQHRYFPSKYYTNYARLDKKHRNYIEFYSQPAEIDACAFAHVVVEENFHTSCEHEGYTPEMIDRVEKRKEEIFYDDSVIGIEAVSMLTDVLSIDRTKYVDISYNTAANEYMGKLMPLSELHKAASYDSSDQAHVYKTIAPLTVSEIMTFKIQF